MGSKDDELYARWVQYGLYSPIMRLHSTSNEFMGKEPWKHEYAAEQIAVKTLRERHALIPYLYSMNYRTHKDSLALCEPMYYAYPEDENAYKVKNQYFFGSELMVAPITSKINPKTNLAEVEVWLPEGRWTDIYTGAIYQGGKKIKMFRGIESIPVLAKEGAIIPMSANDRDNDWTNPKDMVIRIFRGNNSFNLYEDDGETNAYQKGDFAITKYTVSEADDKVCFTISPAEGNCSTLPKKRNYTLIFEDISSADISLTVNGKEAKFEAREKKNRVYVTINGITPKSIVEVSLTDVEARVNIDKKEQIIDLITKYQLSVSYKQVKFTKFLKNIDGKLPSCDACIAEPIIEIQNML